MNVLFSDETYSYLFPGGKQVHAQKLFRELNGLGISVTYENWHDPSLRGDVVHFFGFNDVYKIRELKKRGYKLVYTHIVDGLTNLPAAQLIYHQLKNQLIQRLPGKFDSMFPWRLLPLFDAIVYMHENDRRTAIRLYGVDPAKTRVIPHAVDALETWNGPATAAPEPKYLVTVGSIVERKNPLFTARLCRKLNIPIRFMGHPFDEQSDYFRAFLREVDSTIVRYDGFTTEEQKAEILKNASGFVLLSFGESGCISVYEAAAAGLPLLLSDLPWARGYEEPLQLFHCPPSDESKAAQQLQAFYQAAQRGNSPSFTVHTWKEIAEQYADVYRHVLQR